MTIALNRSVNFDKHQQNLSTVNRADLNWQHRDCTLFCTQRSLETEHSSWKFKASNFSLLSSLCSSCSLRLLFKIDILPDSLASSIARFYSLSKYTCNQLVVTFVSARFFQFIIYTHLLKIQILPLLRVNSNTFLCYTLLQGQKCKNTFPKFFSRSNLRVKSFQIPRQILLLASEGFKNVYSRLSSRRPL